MPKCRVGVAVLGDLGRSPRMQYHAHSLARHGHPVHLVGYPGSPLPDTLATNTHVTVRHRKLYRVKSHSQKRLNFRVGSKWHIFQCLIFLFFVHNSL